MREVYQIPTDQLFEELTFTFCPNVNHGQTGQTGVSIYAS